MNFVLTMKTPMKEHLIFCDSGLRLLRIMAEKVPKSGCYLLGESNYLWYSVPTTLVLFSVLLTLMHG